MPRTSLRCFASSGRWRCVAKLKFVVPPSALNPAATATPSTSVDFPLPFSPTKIVMRGSKSSVRTPRKAGRLRGYERRSTSSPLTSTLRMNAVDIAELGTYEVSIPG